MIKVWNIDGIVLILVFNDAFECSKHVANMVIRYCYELIIIVMFCRSESVEKRCYDSLNLRKLGVL